MRQSHKTVVLWVLLGLMVLFIYQLVSAGKQVASEREFSAFMKDVTDGKVEQVTIKGNHFTVALAGNERYQTWGLKGEKVVEQLLAKNVTVKFDEEESTPFWQSALITWLPMLVLLFLFVVFMRQLQAGGGKAMAFGKSKAKLLTEHQQRVTFKDVAGVDEAKDELEEIISFLKDPKKFTRLGGHIPKGVLLMGPPGTGKTLLARAIAGEAGVPFFSISGSDFVEMFVGVGASRVRDLFEQGKKNAPCIVFIDEIDAVGRHRGAGLGGGHDEREQTLNQLLVEMDGFESNDGVILIAATNRPDVLDPALLRPGRFDRRIVVPRPDVKGREGILGVHTKKTPVSDDVDLSVLARGTPGCSGADLQNLVNEAALLAARRDGDKVTMRDFEAAKDKVLMGSERRSMIISDREKRITAYHESGHALVAALLENSDPLHKVTIIPRGMALGLTQQIPEDDKYTYSKEYVENRIGISMGGRIAEELVFNEITTGAGNDIEQATDLARKMVCEWGMSEQMGPLSYGKREENIFLGRDFTQHQEYSERTAITIDEEVQRIVMRNYERARRLLEAHVDMLHTCSQALLEYETLEGADVMAIVKGEWKGVPRGFTGTRPARPGRGAVEKKTEEKARVEAPVGPPGGGVLEPSGAARVALEPDGGPAGV